MARTKQTANKKTKKTRVSKESAEEERRRLAQLEIEAGRLKRRCRQEELDIEERELNMLLRREEALFNKTLQSQGYELEVRKVALQETEMKMQEQQFVHANEMAREKLRFDKAQVELDKARLEAQVEIDKHIHL